MTAADDPLPDLTVGTIQARRDSGGAEHVSAVVTNRGSATANGAVARFTDGCGSCGAKTIGDSSLVTLAPGASARVEIVWNAAPRGSRTVTAVADPANKIRESREDNNKCQVTLTVR